jgi:hypothetical protein
LGIPDALGTWFVGGLGIIKLIVRSVGYAIRYSPTIVLTINFPITPS